MNIDEFLLARAAEQPSPCAEALRGLVEMYGAHDHSANADHKWSGFSGGYATATEHMLRVIATQHQDHPDCDPDWVIAAH